MILFSVLDLGFWDFAKGFGFSAWGFCLGFGVLGFGILPRVRV